MLCQYANCRNLIAASVAFVLTLGVDASDSAELLPSLTSRANVALGLLRDERFPDAATITSLILQGDYVAFESLARTYEARWKRNPSLELSYELLLNTVDEKNPALQAKLDDWVAQRPSDVSYGVRGIYEMNRGFLLRFQQPAHATPRERMEAMATLHQRAKVDLAFATQANRRFTPGYTALIRVALAQGDAATAKTVLAEAIKYNPSTYSPRAFYMVSLQPRWGGSFEKMQAFADTLDSAAKINPLIWTIKGDVAAERGYVAQGRGDYELARRNYEQALAFGERDIFLKGRGLAYWGLLQHQLALEDLTKCSHESQFADSCEAYAAQLKAFLARRAAQRASGPK